MTSLVIVAALAAFALTPLASAFARRIGAVDTPGPRKRHVGVMPRLGGLAVVGGAAAGLLATDALPAGPSAGVLNPLLAGGLIVFVTGLVDDVRSLPAWMKLGLEFLAAHIVVSGDVAIHTITIAGGTIHLGSLSYAVTVLWIVGLTNAFNLIDGLDGLATGIALISGSACAWLLMMRGNLEEAALLFALAGAALGFLPWNLPPARAFLGDAGSLSFGFTLAVTAITGLQKGATALSTAVALLLFAIPIAEVLASVGRRSFAGARVAGLRGLLRVLSPDQEHLHHRLVGAGLSPRSVALLFYGVTLALSVVALLTARIDG